MSYSRSSIPAFSADNVLIVPYDYYAILRNTIVQLKRSCAIDQRPGKRWEGVLDGGPSSTSMGLRAKISTPTFP